MSGIRRQLKRYEGLNHARYLTCSCYRRLPLFGNDSIKDAFVEHLGLVQRMMGFDLYAWVVMPEHMHLVLRPAMPQTVTEVLRRLKAPFGRRVLNRWRELKAPILARLNDHRGLPRFWQPGGGYDRNLYSDDELHEKINYTHANPIRRGLVKRATDYAWSSARHNAGQMNLAGPAITPIP